MKISFTVLVHLLIFINNANLSAQILRIGETLTYSVTWYSICLGVIETKVTDMIKRADTNIYKILSIFKTHSHIPIISISDTLYSDIDEQFYSRYFLSHEWNIDEGQASSYTIDYNNKVFYYTKWNLTSKCDSITKSIAFDIPKLQDGISSMYYVRYLSGKDTTVEFPTLISGKIKWTEVISTGEKEIRRLHEKGIDVEVFQIEGKAKYDGFRGFSGIFRVWFSADDRRIPVYAELEFILGKVKIRLEDDTLGLKE